MVLATALTTVVGADSAYDALITKNATNSARRHTLDRVATATSGYAVATNDQLVVLDATGGAFTVTLPASPVDCEWHSWKVISVSGGNITLQGNGHNIDSAATKVLSTQWQYIAVEYDSNAGKWWIVA